VHEIIAGYFKACGAWAMLLSWQTCHTVACLHLRETEEYPMTDYGHYQHLLFERKDHGILLITINRPEVYNAANARLHWELSRVWLDIADDPATRVVVVTGAGPAFSAGGGPGFDGSFQGRHKGHRGAHEGSPCNR